MGVREGTTFHWGTTRADYSEAHCKGQDPTVFMEYDLFQDARKVCRGCPCAADCYFEAVRDDLHGCWGGIWHGKTGRPGSNQDKRGQATMLMKLYRAELCHRMGLTVEQFTARFGVARDGIRRALRSL